MAKEAGDEGWHGTFAEMAFRVSRTSPYLTAPREVARIQAVNVCNRVWPVANQFLEYLQFGNGRMPKTRPYCDWPANQVYSRNNVPVFSDPTENTPYFVRVYATNAADTTGASRVFLQGNDPQGNPIYSQDSNNEASGEYVTLAAPFASSTNLFQGIPYGIQKDVTFGPVQFFWVDATTGAQTLMLTMQPGETTASYRRYYFNALPVSCVDPASDVTVTAIVKLDLIPVKVDTDYCLIQSQEALINECEAVRYDGMDNAPSAAMADRKHKKAIQLLNGQIAHFIGIDDPAVNFAPFGNAHFAQETSGFI